MQLTKFSDYALRVLMYVAQGEGRPATIAEIARAHGISRSHLMKVVNRLAQLGYLTTQRGKGGGIALGRPAAGISVGQVLRDFEPLAVVECLAPSHEGACRLTLRCGLQHAVHVAQHEFLGALDRHTLAEISRVSCSARPAAAAASPGI